MVLVYLTPYVHLYCSVFILQSNHNVQFIIPYIIYVKEW